MKKLIPLFGILLAALVVMSTGAFTSVTADRDATINVAGDASALLALAPVADGTYAEIVDNGVLRIDATLGATGSGVNPEAVTDFGNVFTITNNGTQDVTVTLTKTGNNESVFTFSAESEGDIESGITIASGEVKTISIIADTTEVSEGGASLTSINISATA